MAIKVIFSKCYVKYICIQANTYCDTFIFRNFKGFAPPHIFSKQYGTFKNPSEILQDDGSTDLGELREFSILNKKKSSKAMRAYLQRAREHTEFMKQQLFEYNIGKRHLANMMGQDPETFTQEDVDKAIQYLFPSGLFSLRSRPMMKPPEEIFPPRKAAQFDETGRPFHFLFYTSYPNFYQLLFNIASHIEELNSYEDEMIAKKITPDSHLAVITAGFEWVPLKALEEMLTETVTEHNYGKFVQAISRLAEHPYSYRVLEFIDKYRKPLIAKMERDEIPKPEIDADGRQFVTFSGNLRKRSNGEVTVKYPGTGKVNINGKGLDYFPDIPCREQLLFPLLFTGMLDKVDIEAIIEGSGPMGQAGGIRWGISMCLRSFVDEKMVEEMRLAGLLQKDVRRRERKKPGQEGARRKFTWKKR